MLRSIVAPFFYVVALPAALAACGYVEIAPPYDTSGGTGDGPAVTGSGGEPAFTGSGGGPAFTGSGGSPAITGSGGSPAITGSGGSGAGGEDASSTGSTGTSSGTGPSPEPSCAAAHCAVSIAEGAPMCAVSASSEVFCWWGGAILQTRLAAAAPVEGLDDVVAASGRSGSHVCFLHADGRVSCLGMNFGQFGRTLNNVERSAVPVVLPDVEGVVQLSSGILHSCGLLGSGNVICWGRSRYPQLLGVENDVGQAVVTVSGLDDAVQVAAHIDHTCALRATGEVVCWGVLTTGEAAATPVRVEGVEGAVEITAGMGHDCARLASGKVLCWGNNEAGALGDGTREPRSEPVEVLGLDDAIQVSAGNRWTCALRQGGKVVCWGTTRKEIDIPEAVHVSVGFAGGYDDNACAALASGEIACWTWPDAHDVVVFGL